MNASLLTQLDLQTPSQLTHHVARCQWQTSFDGDRQGAWQLQEVLSHWTNTVLKGLLDRLFSRYCPDGYTWRIDQITLDLGAIDYDELATELPKRVGEALTLQLQRLLPFACWASQSDNPATGVLNPEHASQLLDSAWQAFVRHYLRTGTVPWWYRGPLNHQQVIRAQLAHAPTQVAAIIRPLGRIESVRKRLVWQYYPEPLNALVRALEPYHHAVIEQFADHLIDVQQQQQLGGDHTAVARQSWSWILTHLLVERGSLFNTTAFVISTLQQMAHHYQLDYARLLGQMLQAAQALKQSHPQLPVFIQALLAAEQQLTGMTDKTPVTTRATDPWQQFEHRLRGKTTRNRAMVNHLAEMFAVLARQNAHRMAACLRRVGHLDAVRGRIIQAFGDAELAAVVVVLVPIDHAFVLSHVAHSKKALHAESSPSDTVLVWQVVLAYLLKNSGSYFNRRQFVAQTLRYWSQARAVDYGLLLDLLSSAPPDYHGSEQRFELLVILTDLKQLHHAAMGQQTNQQRQDWHRTAPDTQLAHYRQHLRRYLSHGQMGQMGQMGQRGNGAALLPTPQALLAILLYRDPEGLATLLREGWAQSHHSLRWLSRLVSLLSLADSPVLLRTLALGVADWLLPLLALDGEQGLEIGLMLLLSQSVAELRIKSVLTSLNVLSPALVTALQQSLNNPTRVLSDEIRSTILAWLKQPSRGATELHPVSAIAQIMCLLRGQRLPVASSASDQVNGASPSLAQRLKQHLPGSGDTLLGALQRDPQSSRLAHTLLQQMPEVPALKVWLVALWPKDVMPARRLLPLLSERLQASGLWQGSIARLEQLLRRQLWLTVLTQAMTTSAKANAFWRHLVLGLIRPLGLSPQQLFTALANKAGKTGEVGEAGEAVDHSDAMARAISAALSGDGWLNCHSQSTRDSHFSDADRPSSGESSTQGKRQGERGDSDRHSSNEAPFNKPWIIDAAGCYLQQPAMAEVLTHWLRYGRAPLWWSTTPGLSLAALLADVLAFAPSLLVTVLRQTQTRTQGHSTVVRRLANLMDFSALLTLMGQTEPALAGKLSALARIDEVLRAGLLGHISPTLGDLPRLLLWQYTVQAWLGGGSSYWHALTPQAAVSALYGQLIDRYPEAKRAVAEAFAKPFAQYVETPDTDDATATEPIQAQLDRLLPPLPGATADETSTPSEEQLTMPIAVSNAGLVIMQNFIQNYFSRLDLSGDDGFVSEQAQLDAVHWLQLLVTGHHTTDETHLTLNKVLCGLPLSTPVATGIEVAEAQQQLAEGLIGAVIQYWSAIGSSSIEGFRGNWLVRDGLLSETDEHWALAVEKRPYDLLLERLPFAFSLVRLPWMDKPLYVTWPT